VRRSLVPDDDLGWWTRARSAVEHVGAGAILGSPWLCARLAGSRRDPVDGRTLAPDVAAMLVLDDINNHSDLRRMSPTQARTAVEASILVVGPGTPPGVVHEDRELAGPAGTIRVRLYSKEGAAGDSLPGVVYLHGGGWVTGSVASHDGLCRLIALGAGCRVASVEYRRAPEDRFPAALDDCLAATRWILAHAEELGMDPARIAVAGDSAGGNLSAVVARKTRGDARRLALQLLLYPALDGTCALPSHRSLGEGYFLTAGMCAWYYSHYAGDHDRRDPDLSPLLAEDACDVPAFVVTAGFDPLRDEGKAYADLLRNAGTHVTYREIENTVHGFALMGGALASARASTNEVIAELGQLLTDHSRSENKS
jgi:acetyl esterase